jgi:hypothetical protein
VPDYTGQNVGGGFPRQNRFAATNTIWGAQRVATEPVNILFDSFDASIDIINKWGLSNGGGGVLPAYTTASATLNSGTTANGWSLMKSLTLFPPRQPSMMSMQASINVEFPVLTTGYRFWGFFNATASPTIAAPVTDGVGFEVGITGNMYAVSWSGGSRIVIGDLGGNGAQPGSGAAHTYYLYFRADQCFWAIDNPDNIVANYPTGSFGPNVNTLPAAFLAISNGSTAVTIPVNGMSVADYAPGLTQPYLFNGYTTEPQRGNTDTNASLLTLAAQGAGTVNSAAQINTNGRGVVVGINTTVDTAGAYTVNLQGQDVVSGTWYTIASSASVIATGFATLTLYPGITAATNTAVSAPLPRTWRVQAVVTTGPITATIGASVIV